MTKSRGRSHTTTTETAVKVVKTLAKISGIKMIAPGEIASKRSAGQSITIRRTQAGCIITVSGNGIQKLNIHTINQTIVSTIATTLKESKKLRDFSIKIK